MIHVEIWNETGEINPEPRGEGWIRVGEQYADGGDTCQDWQYVPSAEELRKNEEYKGVGELSHLRTIRSWNEV